ncbi:cysteine desulfuration protein SufE [Pantoea sp. Aalb]|uniref:cysteine desulfuration protein SufE n=1 Tax=Pantoea sp. Aalb TaxID=2576762 RepID=UPI0013245F0C|nr:cysteine desulfuration protein SufE [Pantoea sp. Aalb]MXP67424.1 cysteine desulfuration protein SufE [Pantoea sp. Aalb]
MVKLPDIKKILYNFNRCSNWEEKYLYIIELGKKLPEYSKTLYHKEHLVSGCQSQVWIRMILQTNGSIEFEGDSDTAIVKGLIALVFILYNGLNVKQIIDLNINYFFNQLKLTQFLTPSRTQGLEAMIRTIRYHAQNILLHY